MNNKKLNIVAVIHARGGSKRIPLKNIKLLGGLPLIAYPIKLCKSIPAISRVIVSTDHPEIARVSKEFGAEVPFVRPADISEDVASEMVQEHAIRWLIDNGDRPDCTLTLTPATPFTKRTDVEKAISLLESHPQWDSVITVRKAKEFPQWMIDLSSDGSGKTLLGNSFDGEYNVSQNLKKYYYPMGAFFLNRVSSFLQKPSMYGNSWGCVELDPRAHVDIDDPEDLEEANRILSSGAFHF
jgi:CMP-N-acetylneuraminic acid synthetase